MYPEAEVESSSLSKHACRDPCGQFFRVILNIWLTEGSAGCVASLGHGEIEKLRAFQVEGHQLQRELKPECVYVEALLVLGSRTALGPSLSVSHL